MKRTVICGVGAIKNKLYRTLKFKSEGFKFKADIFAIFGDGDTLNVYRNENTYPYYGYWGITHNSYFESYHTNGQIQIYTPIVESVESFLKERKLTVEDLEKYYICTVSLVDFISFVCNEELTMRSANSYASYKFTILYEFFDADGFNKNIRIHRNLPKEDWPEVIGHVNPRLSREFDYGVEYDNVYRWKDGTVKVLAGDNMPRERHFVEEARNVEKPEYWGLPEYRGSIDDSCELIKDETSYIVSTEGLSKAPITGYRLVERTVEVTDSPSDGDSWGFGATRGSVTYKTTETESIPMFGERVKITKEDLPDLSDDKHKLFRNMVEGYELVGYDHKKLVELYKKRFEQYHKACDDRIRKQRELCQDWIDSQEWYQI